MADGTRVALHHAVRDRVADRGCTIACGEAGRTMARRVVADEAATGWTVTGKAVHRGDVAGKPVSTTAGDTTHGVKTAMRSAARVEAAAVKTTGRAHGAWMEAASAGMEAAAGMEATATYMKTSTTGMKASTTTGMKASTTAGMETATAATVKAAASTAMEAAASTSMEATAARACLRQAGQREARNGACEDCGYHQRSLPAGNTHVFLPCKTAVGKAGNATHCFKNSFI
ncbi:hypothetical protein [Bradyrhizobium sp. STM 3557]|uniref:hypothetical protein n=1 Tax=Bradyrhizobium sp. STM 3557 TaxID=578920 RepID=UPI00388E18A9